MDFNDFLLSIKKIEEIKPNGSKSHNKLAPLERKNIVVKKDANRAAVLALFYPNEINETHIILTKRASYQGTHTAQISFPGGKPEQIDQNLFDTSTRETDEEVGIKANSINFVKEITDIYIPPSNFLVTPFLAYIDYRPNFSLNNEVDKVIEVKIEDLLDSSNLTTDVMNTSYMKNITIPCFNFYDNIVWGATAMILSEIKDILKQL